MLVFAHIKPVRYITSLYLFLVLLIQPLLIVSKAYSSEISTLPKIGAIITSTPSDIGFDPDYPGNPSNLSDPINAKSSNAGAVKRAKQDLDIDQWERYAEWGNIEKAYDPVTKLGTQYNWTNMDNTLEIAAKNNVKLSLRILMPHGPSQSTGKLPAGLTFNGFDQDNPTYVDFKAEFKDFSLDLIRKYENNPAYQGIIQYFWIGIEVDDYFWKRFRDFNKPVSEGGQGLDVSQSKQKVQQEITVFNTLVREVKQAVQAEFPLIKVGTITTYHNALKKSASDSTGSINSLNDIVIPLHQEDDIIGWTFYHLDTAGMKASGPPEDSETLGADDQLQNLLNFSKTNFGSRKLYLTEVGWNSAVSSQGVNESVQTLGEQEQLEYVKLLFNFLKTNKNDIEGLGYWNNNDINQSTAKSQSSLITGIDQNTTDPDQLALLNLWTIYFQYWGLRTYDGRQKPAYQEWITQKLLYDDVTAPAISNINIINTSPKSATVTWQTDENSLSAVNYGPDESYGNTESIAEEYTTNHSVNLTNLGPGQTYNYQVVSTDASNNESISTNLTFQTVSQPTHNQADLSKIVLNNETWRTPSKMPSPVNFDGWEDSVVADYNDNNKLYFSYFSVDAINYLNDLVDAWLNGQTPDPQEFKRNYMIGPEREGSRGRLNTDIYEATYSNNNWQIINSSVNDNAQNSIIEEHSPSIPATNDVMYMQKTSIGTGQYDDIYKSVKNDQGQWAAPVIENVLNQPGSIDDSNPHVSADGNTIFFDSNRTGGTGNKDLWFSTKDSDQWTTPQPIEALNTSFKEWQPFITKDGKTLYFSSDTLDGVSQSKLSIFKSEFNGNSWGPRQLVAKIDDSSTDIVGLGEPSLSANGDKLYFLYVYAREDGFYESNIAVANHNNRPELDLIENKQILEEQNLKFNIVGTDPDSDPLTYSASNLPSGANFTGNTFSWKPNRGQKGRYIINFQVTDGSLTANQSITIDVLEKQLTPVPDEQQIDNTKPRIFSKKAKAYRKGKKKLAIARLSYYIKDQSNTEAKVRLVVQKRIRSKKTGKYSYRTVKTIRYQHVSVNQWHYYMFRTTTEGVFRYLIYASDHAGNPQLNVAKSILIVI